MHVTCIHLYMLYQTTTNILNRKLGTVTIQVKYKIKPAVKPVAALLKFTMI